jgi:hypothetical protein
MWTRYRRKLVLPIVVLGLLTLGAGVAVAHTVRADSQIVNFRYTDANERFAGNVTSERFRCERRRTVQVFRDKPQHDQFVGEDRTTESGFWAVDDPGAHGDFYAKVLRRVVTREGHRHVCRGDRSGTIFVQ